MISFRIRHFHGLFNNIELKTILSISVIFQRKMADHILKIAGLDLLCDNCFIK